MTTVTEIEERNLRAVSDVLRYWNTQNVPGILTFYNEDIVWDNVAMEETYRGKAEVGRFLDSLMHAFPDLNFDVTHKIASDNQVSEQWHIRGTHLGAFMGIPPTGKRVDIPGISMVEMRDGKFLRDQFYFDSGIVLRQMGIMPSLKASQSPPGRAALWLLVKARGAGAMVGMAAGAVAGLALLRSVRRRRR
ncbi:MAG: ester cyclase [Chloroflexi bacterium]|nr:ester cyclase [Chloroflexota bacterium]